MRAKANESDAPPERQRHEEWAHLEPRQVVPTDAGTPVESHRTVQTRRVGIAVLVVAAISALAWAAAGPSHRETGMAAPITGNLRLSSRGLIAPLVIVHGSETGLELVRAPTSGRPRVVAIDAADRELRVISLGRAPLTLQADIAGPRGVQSMGATGRVVVLFQNERATGVRTVF